MKLILEKEKISNFSYDLISSSFSIDIELESYVKYLKGVYSNLNRLKERFTTSCVNRILKEDQISLELKEKSVEFFQKIEELFEIVEPFTYKEAFEIKNENFRALVFGSISIREMMEHLGCRRIKVEGIPVKRKQYSETGEFIGYKEYDAIYENYEIDGKELGIENDKFYFVKCWCTSTNKEAFIWIKSEYKDSPLEAIASTFVIHKNLVPYIKELKRHGDILMVELTEEVEPEGDEMVTLTKDQYFSLLTAEG